MTTPGTAAGPVAAATPPVATNGAATAPPAPLQLRPLPPTAQAANGDRPRSGGLSSSANPSAWRMPVTFVAAVDASGSRTATGSVRLGGAPLDAEGQATLGGLRPGASSHGMTATYSGDGNFAASAAALTVALRTASRISVSATPDPAGLDDRVTLLAAVASTAAIPPTGTVTFTLSGAVAGSPPVVDGHATLQVVPGDAGRHTTVVACYSGDDALAPSSASATVAVDRAATTIAIAAVARPDELGAGGG